MDIQFSFSDHDIRTVRDVIKANKKDAFVVRREARNCRGAKPSLDRRQCWLTHLMCLLTTQQRSGPTSPVNRFLTANPFPLTITAVKSAKSPAQFSARVLQEFGGIQRYNRVGKEIAKNLELFHGEKWRQLKLLLSGLKNRRGFSAERKAATWLADSLSGFGPKQSRNFLQALGLTRYEIPIDSRIVDWLRKDFNFPLALSPAALNDPDHYAFVNDVIRKLCQEAKTYPCILDAALFARVDQGKWKGAKHIF